MTHVELCGVGFSGDETPDAGLIFSSLVDWDGLPEARGETDPVPGADGAYSRANIYRASRAVSVNAAIVADTVDEFLAVRRRVEAMPAQGTMRVDLGDGFWSRHVEVQKVTIPDARAGTETEFTIDLIAPDPIRYRETVTVGPVGLPVRFGGLVLPSGFPWNFGTSFRPSVTVVNDGSVPLLPVVTVRGSADSLTVHGGPRRIEFGAFNGVLVIDNRERRVWLNGGDVTRQLIRRDWQSVPADGSQEFFFDAVNASPETALTVEYRIGVW